MRCLIRRRAEDGAWSEREVEVPAVTLGRGTQCTVELPGLLVALEHAELRQLSDGQYRLESKSVSGVEVQGVAGVRSCKVLPGDRLRIGDHMIRIDPVRPGTDLVLSIEHKAGGKGGKEGPALDLRAGGLRMRLLVMVGVTVVLVLGALIPLLTRGLDARPPRVVAMLSDAFWLPGQVSHAHAHLARDCSNCHQGLFRAVSGAVCTACHAEMPHHSDSDALAAGPEIATDCTQCHREHRGSHGLAADSPALCAGCHARPEDFAQVASLAPAKDFADEHPEFTPDPGGADDSGLIFSHARHLEGVRGPNGITQLRCRDCHVPDAGHVEMRMPKFDLHCRSCHVLSVTIGGTETDLPHGQSTAAARLLELAATEATTRRQAPSTLDLRQRAGPRADRGSGADPAERASELFEYRLCGQCHQTERAPDGHPRVRPPVLRSDWLTGTAFSHAPHKAVRCSDCHAAESSTAGSDLLLPGIAVCRTCHAGVDSGHGIPTPCVDCHRFHRAKEKILAGGAMPEPAAP